MEYSLVHVMNNRKIQNIDATKLLTKLNLFLHQTKSMSDSVVFSSNETCNNILLNIAS